MITTNTLSANARIDTPEFWALANAWASSTIDTPRRAAALVAFIQSKSMSWPTALTPAMRDAVFPKWTFQPESMYADLVAAVAIQTQAPRTSQASADVLAERQRQIDGENWTSEHDDAHPCGEIAAFAAVYAMPPAARDWPAADSGYGDTFCTALCPEDWQPKFGDRRRELVKAGALILAEIERLDRIATTTPGDTHV